MTNKEYTNFSGDLFAKFKAGGNDSRGSIRRIK